MNPRVLHVTPGLSIGGTPALMVKVVQGLARQGGWDQSVVCLKSPQSRYAGYVLPEEPIFLHFSGQWLNPLATARCIWRLRHRIRQKDADLVHSYVWLADVIAAAAVRGTRARHVSYIVDTRAFVASRKLRHRLRRALTALLFRRAHTRFLAISEAARDYFCAHMGVCPDDVTVAHNSIDPAAWPPPPPRTKAPGQPVVIGTASRLAHEKGLEYLIEAIAQLAQETALPFQVRITGEGPLRHSLEARIRAAGLESRVTLLGWVDSMARFYGECDLFVVPSTDTEGLPTTILEAMFCECAVVASDVAGAREVITHGENGWLVPPRDVPALAGTLHSLLENAEPRREIGRRARERIRDHFTVDHLTRRVEEAYRRALSVPS